MIPSKIKIKILALRRIFAALGTKGLIRKHRDEVSIFPQYSQFYFMFLFSYSPLIFGLSLHD